MMNAVYAGDHRVLCVNALGMMMVVDGRDISLAPHIIRGSIWEEHMTNLVTTVLHPGMTFIDVGANVGWFSLAASRLVGPEGKVIAVEANPDTYDLLRTNLEINGFSDRATAWRKAAWHEDAELEFHVMRKHKGGCSVRRDAVARAVDLHDDAETIRVEAMRLDDMVGDELPVHLVKIDAEGAEPSVLRGMRRIMAQNKELCITVEFAPAWFPDDAGGPFLDEIEGYGFKIRKLDPNAQLLALNHDELMRIPHNDLLLVPADMDI